MECLVKKKLKKSVAKKIPPKSFKFIPTTQPKLIVGIGLSAGGLQPLETLFTSMTHKTGLAFIVISHLDSDSPSMLPEIIQRHTQMRVAIIHETLELRSDTIYVIPPDKLVILKKNKFSITKLKQPHHLHPPIDIFFKSLAADQKKKAVGIILSGSGADGAAGIKAIKKSGGIVMVQDPQSAKFDSMPQSALEICDVDYVLTPEKIAAQLSVLAKSMSSQGEENVPEIQQIIDLLYKHTGHNFSPYKLNTITRRIKQQMALHNIKTMSAYCDYLLANPLEIHHLFQDLLIGVTSFFRDGEAYDYLQENILPAILKNKNSGYHFRVWVPGCATGEEVYSLAIVIREVMDKMRFYGRVQIFGTDIDNKSLDIARLGTYTDKIVETVSPARLKKFFVKDKKSYKVSTEIRSMAVFGSHNLIQDPPFIKLDMISCRNLLIYLGLDVQKDIFRQFHYSLKPNGVLFLGTSEGVSDCANLFRMINNHWKIFARKEPNKDHSAPVFHQPVRTSFTAHKRGYIVEDPVGTQPAVIESIKEAILKQSIETCIGVDKKGHILYTQGSFSAHWSALLNHHNANILLNLPEQHSNKLRQALLSAAKQTSLVTVNISNTSLKITKLKINKPYMIFLITFKNIITPHQIKQTLRRYTSTSRLCGRILELESSMLHNNNNLQTSIEELQSANEELQSTNEELQSTNEEIESTKEELHSLNEELLNVNTELQTNYDNLTLLNDDLVNLFNSTEIAAIFLDQNMTVKRFTPKAQAFVHLIASDIGRSIKHFSININYKSFAIDIEEVIKNMLPKTVNVQGGDELWYRIRYIPYRTIKKVLDGLIITFENISHLMRIEKELGVGGDSLLQQLNVFLPLIPEAVVVIDHNYQIVAVNKSCNNLLGIKRELSGTNLLALSTAKPLKMLSFVGDESDLAGTLIIESPLKIFIKNARKISPHLALLTLESK
jgi:two-component system CheB/CheR fusion protein